MMTEQEFEVLTRKYDELLQRLVKGADFVENPIIKPGVHEAAMKKFDRIWNEAMEVREKWWNHALRRERA